MSWAEALKEHAKQTGKFTVPKKGTPEYEAVAKIHRKLKGIPDPAPEKPKRKSTKPIPEKDAPVPPNNDEEKKKALDALHEQGLAEKKAAKAAAKAASKKAIIEEKKAIADKEERYAKLEADMVKIKQMLGHKERSPAVLKKIEEKVANPPPEVVARQQRIAASAAKKAAREAAKASFKVEEKPVTLTFSD
jgi:hypothetical protein